MDEPIRTMGLVLIADDDPAFREAFAQMLAMRGYETIEAGDRNATLDLVRKKRFDAVTIDLDWETEDYTGIDILKAIQEIDPLLPAVVITGHGSIPTAVEATRLGAFDFIEKLADREKTLLVIRNAVESGRLKRKNRAFLNEIRARYEIIGMSTGIGRVAEQIRKAGPTDAVVLITGESGTGKELVARQLHYHSSRGERKFVAIDLGAITETLAESELFGHRRGAFTGATQDRAGLIEEAEGGTLFFDEISNASLALQARLLHVIQERKYRRVGENDLRTCNVRIIAATNQDLSQLAEENRFRGDLRYRLAVIEIAIPPLRERKEDIPLLVERFMELKSRQCAGKRKMLAAEAVNLLLDYDWPGNVRELENAVERIVILSTGAEITVEETKSILGNMWLDKGTSLKSLNEMTREFRRECIIKAINLAEGRIARAAEILQIDRTHLYKLIEEYQLKDLR